VRRAHHSVLAGPHRRAVTAPGTRWLRLAAVSGRAPPFRVWSPPGPPQADTDSAIRGREDRELVLVFGLRWLGPPANRRMDLPARQDRFQMSFPNALQVMRGR